jgi:hypothetical protein
MPYSCPSDNLSLFQFIRNWLTISRSDRFNGTSHLSHWPGLRVKPLATIAAGRGIPHRGHGIIPSHCVTALRQPPSFWQ